MTLAPGTTLGPYHVQSVLGAGGMGEVYRARDTKLHRDVALKVLPDGLADDAERIARFHREAEVLASLSHPNIGAIYGFEDSGDVRALVLELIVGPTLEDVLAPRPLPVDRALAVARQIAEAVEAAHHKGIVHRDLKPANIKIMPGDVVKVLDFGLAKVREVEHAGAPDAATMMTSTPGMILGTTAYMSPEQARGEVSAPTSDIWAFGCVFFEMLTGRRAFEGKTAAEILGRVMATDPNWALLPEETPAAIRRLLRRCLQKNERQRLQHIGDARVEIEEAQREPAGLARTERRTQARWERLAWLSALVLVGAIAAFAFRTGFRDPPVPPEIRLDIAAPPTMSPASFAVSPDGRRIVFSGISEGLSRLLIRSLDAVSSPPLSGTEGAQYPFWAADGRFVGFFADGKLKRIELASGAVQAVTSVSVPTGGSWNREGVILFGANTVGPILRISSAGGETATATTLQSPQHTFHSFPQFLPDGRHFLYYVVGVASSQGVYVGQLDSTDSRRLLEADTPAVFASSGHLLFVRGGTLYSQRFNAGSLSLVGESSPLAEQVMVDPVGLVPALSASAAGAILYRTGTRAGQRQFVWFDRAGKEVGRVGNPDSATAQNPSLSADGSQVALNRSVNGESDVWLLETARGVLTRFTTTDTVDVNPIWSPTHSHIAYGSNRRGVFDLYRKSVATSEPEELLLAAEGSKAPTDWSSDGRFLAYRSQHPTRGWDLLALPMKGEKKPFPVAQTNFDETNGQFSADGKWIAYQSNESGNVEIYVQSFPDAGQKWRVSTSGGTQPRWRRDARELFFIGLDGRLMAVPLQLAPTSEAVEAGTPVPLFPTSIGSMGQGAFRQQFMVSPDGQRFLLNTVPEGNTPITIVLNWKPRS